MRRLGVLFVLVWLSYGVATQSAAAASWSVQGTANPSGPAPTQPAGVSCTSASACTAVGEYQRASIEQTLAQAWNGTSWATQSTPNRGTTGSSLGGVSCTSATACTAVGGGGYRTLAEAWNGTTWTTQSTPDPSAGAGSYLNGVSCTSASACTAVGFFYNSSAEGFPLAEAWNGTSWKVQGVPRASTTYNQLNAVSCTSTTACTAVGVYTNSSNVNVPLAAVWNGTSWKLQAAHSPAGATYSDLLGVSCTSASACTAVGIYEGSSGWQGLTEVWNGTSWKIESASNPSGGTNSELFGVSCTSASACTAVGYYETSSHVWMTLAEVWNGTSWTPQSTPNPSGGTNSELYGVSCVSASSCTAVGYYTKAGTTTTLAEDWNGTSWEIQATPNPTTPEEDQLSAVSCPSASSCTAVGNYYVTGGDELALAEMWNGTSWKLQAARNILGASANQLNGVSCPSASACTAVGYAVGGGSYQTLIEAWNGTSWKLQGSPLGGQLYAVSCSSASACAAVGRSGSSGSYATLTEIWNGTSWTPESSPNPGDAINSTLTGVSCTSASACTAVGYYNTSSTAGTFAEVWNGTSWTLQTVPSPSGSTYSQLAAVSCTSASACTAVGNYDDSIGDQLPLVEVWNGTSWTPQSAPDPGGAQYPYMLGVSCTSASACTAVGYSNNTPAAFAEAWNGTSWSLQSTATPAGATATQLNGVSCASASACTAAGDFNNGHMSLTLAERYS